MTWGTKAHGYEHLQATCLRGLGYARPDGQNGMGVNLDGKGHTWAMLETLEYDIVLAQATT
jgi:hypothetical protein